MARPAIHCPKLMGGLVARAQIIACWIAVAAVAMLSAAEHAGAQTIGANFNRPANVQYGCELVPSVTFDGFRQFFPSGVSTCTYLPSIAFGNFSESTAAPSGLSVVTRIQVKTGPRVGPMRAAIIRQLGSTTVGLTCCHFAGQSQVFTPRRNGVTSVPVRLPLESSIDPANGISTQDYVGLTVLAPNVPIPGHEPGGVVTNLSPNNPNAGGFFPHIGPNSGPRVDQNGIGGLQILIRATLSRICGTGAAAGTAEVPSDGASASANGCSPALAVGVGNRSGSSLRIPLTCNISLLPCSGRVQLQSRSNPNAFDAAKSKRATYASGKVKVGTGKRKTVKLKLTKQGKKLLKRKKKVRVWANVTFGKGAQKVISTQKTKIKR